MSDIPRHNHHNAWWNLPIHSKQKGTQINLKEYPHALLVTEDPDIQDAVLSSWVERVVGAPRPFPSVLFTGSQSGSGWHSYARSRLHVESKTALTPDRLSALLLKVSAEVIERISRKRGQSATPLQPAVLFMDNVSQLFLEMEENDYKNAISCLEFILRHGQEASVHVIMAEDNAEFAFTLADSFSARLVGSDSHHLTLFLGDVIQPLSFVYTATKP